MAKMSPREARRKAFLKRQQASQQVSAGFHGIFKANANVKVWKAEKGRHDIDIIPYQVGSHDPAMKPGEWTYVLEVFVHNNVGPEENKVFICPLKTYGDPCPICEHRRELIEREADEDLIKSLTVSKYPRSIYNIVCHDDSRSRNEVQVFNTSHFLFEKELVELSQSSPRQIEEGEPPIINFADPEGGDDGGRGIIFTREGDGRSTTFTGISFTRRKKAIPDSILEKAYVLDEIIHIPTYDEIYEAFWGQKREDAEDDRDEDESPRRGSSRRESRREQPKERKPSTKGRSRREEPEEEEEETDDDDSYLNKNEVSKESDESAEGECPNGGVFGEDHEKLDECGDCGVWEECLVESEKLAEEGEEPEKEEEEEPEPEDEPEEEEEEEEPKEKPSRGSRSSRTSERSNKPSGRSGEKPSGRTSGRSSGSRDSRGNSGARTGKSSTRTRRSMR